MTFLRAAAIGCALCVPGYGVEADAPAEKTPIVEATPASGYKGVWYHNGAFVEPHGHKYSGGLGTYCAKHSPFAVYCPEADKTFFTYGGTTDESDTELLHMIAYFDHRTGRVCRPRVLLNKQTGDAHDNPVLQVDPDGRVWLFSTSHGRARPSFIHRSVEPYSIDRFERVAAVRATPDGHEPFDNFSYMQVHRSPAAGFVAFFTRYGDPAVRTSMFTTSPDGVAWSSWRRLAAIDEGHYQISAVDGDRAACVFNYHPEGEGLNHRTNLYYVETLDGGATWKAACGQEVAVPVTSPDSPALIHDYRTEGRKVYLKDLRFDPTGAPVALVVTSDGPAPGPASGVRQWELLRWESGEWRRSVVTQSDHNYDMGSLYFEPRRWRIIAPTDPGPQPHGTGGEIVSWSSDDRGRTWRRDTALTSGSEFNHTYVRRPVHAHDDFYALWADGDPRQPSRSRLYFCNRAGEVFRLPEQMEADEVVPESVGRPTTPDSSRSQPAS
ncbi:BNR-4 repeat-containing protein [Botrimarina sp.]|uniref:BNR-4 repeat-containing protein n=1 Tax=Botrimarina sp. TaxID=2795802 RepID=UPI0032ED27F3